MRTNEECVEEHHRRMKSRRRTKTSHRYLPMGVFSVAVCPFLTTQAAVGVSRTTAPAPAAALEGAEASIPAVHGSLGFVLVGLVAFCLGTLVTLLCFRLRRHMKEEEKRDD